MGAIPYCRRDKWFLKNKFGGGEGKPVAESAEGGSSSSVEPMDRCSFNSWPVSMPLGARWNSVALVIPHAPLSVPSAG